ncbi:MAG TPA: YkgJ family cysteine cluster protein [Sedimentisphaerales bacterium]|nr:YkgJ family cysteine cluster protein [Sedimentisphaerales bacterium]
MIDVNGMPWYVSGLHFECGQCGNCCSGPEAGYIWVSRAEVELIADYLKMTAGQVRQDYLRRVGLRTTIIEQPGSKDCIFLRKIDGQKECMIYAVRPRQCRSWPFWPGNLVNPDAWNRAAQKCCGIGRGRLYSFEEIERLKKEKKWWRDAAQTTGSSSE